MSRERRRKRDGKPSEELQPNLSQLSGEAFNDNGKVAGCIPAMGRKGAISFRILRVMPGTDDYPSWADMYVDKIPVRINADLIQPPFFRLFDCVVRVGQLKDEIYRLPVGDKMFQRLGDKDVVFWPEEFQMGRPVIMVDTQQRILSWCDQDNDGAKL